MAKYLWIIFILVMAAALFQLAGYKSLELTIALYSIIFMVSAMEIGGKGISKADIMAKIESLEMIFNDIASNLISPGLRKKRQEVIEWLNKF
jgi:hypothetical protein